MWEMDWTTFCFKQELSLKTDTLCIRFFYANDEAKSRVL